MIDPRVICSEDNIVHSEGKARQDEECARHDTLPNSLARRDRGQCTYDSDDQR